MNKYTLLNNGNIKVTLAVTLSRQFGRTRVLNEQENNVDTKAIVAFARAGYWQKLLDEGKFESTVDLSKNLGLDSSYVARTIRLNLVSPNIIRCFLKGKVPPGMSINKLLKPLPAAWDEQERLLGFDKL